MSSPARPITLFGRRHGPTKLRRARSGIASSARFLHHLASYARASRLFRCRRPAPCCLGVACAIIIIKMLILHRRNKDIGGVSHRRRRHRRRSSSCHPHHRRRRCCMATCYREAARHHRRCARAEQMAIKRKANIERLAPIFYNICAHIARPARENLQILSRYPILVSSIAILRVPAAAAWRRPIHAARRDSITRVGDSRRLDGKNGDEAQSGMLQYAGSCVGEELIRRPRAPRDRNAAAKSLHLPAFALASPVAR